MIKFWLKKVLRKPQEGEGGDEGGGPDAIADLERRVQEANADDMLSELAGGNGGGEGDADAEEARETEREALRKGWTTKDKFKGDPSKWVDAKTFVERGKTFNKNLQNENAALRRQLTEFQGTAEAFKKFHQETMDQRDQELADLQAKLKRQIRQADRDGDDDLVDELENRQELLAKERQKIEEQKKSVQTIQQPAPMDPILRDWIDSGNEWFETDARMRAYSIELGQQLKKENPALAGKDFLARVREEMEKDFPAKFGYSSTTPRRSISDSGNTRETGARTGKTIRDLPAADRELCARFVKEGWTTEDKFLKSYFSRNPS